MTAQQPYALQNSSHPASIFRSAVHSPWRGPGVVAPGEYAVAAQGTPNMSVQVAGGRAWLLGTQVSDVSGQTFSTQSSYFALNDAPVTVTIATANATNPRIDLVYVAVNDSFYSGSNNNAVIGVVTGTPAPTPTVPAAPSNSLTLATVAVAANATSITNSNISNTATAALLATARGGVDPVISTDSTAGTYTGQYRDHPTNGLERWDGSKWGDPLPIDGWTVDSSQSPYTQSMGTAATWTDLPSFASGSFSVTVPAGRTLEVEFKAPRMAVAAGADSRLRLMIGGAQQDAGDWSTSAGVSIYSPTRLTGSVLGTGAAVSFGVQYYGATAASTLTDGGVGPVLMRHRII